MVQDQELQDRVPKQLFVHRQISASELNALRKSHQFPTMAQEGPVAEEEEESNLNFPSLLTEKLK